MMFPIKYNGDVLHHNARVGVDGGIVESLDFVNDLSEQTKRVNMPLLLDIYPNAAAAYSLRKLRTAYTGAAIRVRRSSDNTETDIGFNNAGDLDTSALAAFVGNGNGFVSTWYDQSNNNRHATQTTQANQPIVVSGGTFFLEKNKPVVYANNRTKRMNIPSFTLVGDYSIIIASTLKSFGRNMWMGTLGLSGFVRVFDTQTDGFGVRHNGEVGGANFSGVQTLNPELHFFQRFGTNMSHSRNGVNNITTELSPQGTNFTINLLFDGYVLGGQNYMMDANAFEFIIYNSNQSPNRIGIETNINSYYRIYQQEALLLDYYPDAAAAYSLRKLRSGYTGAAIQVRRSSDNAVQNIGFDSNGGLDVTALTSFVGTGNTGFVSTWYDQSGNNRNATQTGTTAQPVIFSGGTVISENNKASLRFNNNSKYYVDFSLNSPVSTWVVGKKYDNNIDFFIDGRTKNNNNSLLALDATTLRMYDTTGITHTITPYTWLNLNLIFGISNSSSSLVGLNNSFTTGSQPSVNMGGLTIGTAALNDANMLNGSISEIIVYQLNQNSNLLNINSNINSYYNIYPTDSDANVFVTAAGLTNTTQIQAVNKLVTDLKGYGLWGKMKAIYPFVGGTASSHKFNLKDPRDVDGAFRLVFNGGWTHSSSGATPNGTTGWAETYLNPSLLFNNTSFNHLSYYSRTNSAKIIEYVMGIANTNLGSLSMIIRRDTGVRAFFSDFNNAIYRGANDNNSTNAQGYFLGTQQGNNIKLFRNSSLECSNNTITANINPPNNTVVIGALKLDGVVNSFYTDKQCAFATIGDGLTDTEAANLYTAVQAFQTTLGRQV